MTAGPATPRQCPHGRGFNCKRCWPADPTIKEPVEAGKLPAPEPDPITSYYTDRASGHHAAKAP